MNMESVIKVNGVVSRIEGRTNSRYYITMHGRKKQLTTSGKLIENHILSGKFKAATIK